MNLTVLLAFLHCFAFLVVVDIGFSRPQTYLSHEVVLESCSERSGRSLN